MSLFFSQLERSMSLRRWFYAHKDKLKHYEGIIEVVMIQLIEDTINYLENGIMKDHNARIFTVCRNVESDILLPVMVISTRGRTYHLFCDYKNWFVSVHSPEPVTAQIELLSEPLPRSFRELPGIPEELIYPDFVRGSMQFSFTVPLVSRLKEAFCALNLDRHKAEELRAYYPKKA